MQKNNKILLNEEKEQIFESIKSSNFNLNGDKKAFH